MAESRRAAWEKAWRLARIIRKSKPAKPEALVSLHGLHWLAWCRVLSREMRDPILTTPEQNLVASKIIDEIIDAERKRHDTTESTCDPPERLVQRPTEGREAHGDGEG